MSETLVDRLVQAALDGMKGVEIGDDENPSDAQILNAIFVLTYRSVRAVLKEQPEQRACCRQACQILWMETADPTPQ